MPQPCHIAIDDVLLGRPTPDPLDRGLAGDDGARIAHQQLQKLCLAHGQLDRLAASSEDFLGRRVEGDLAEADPAAEIAPTPQQRPQAGHHLFEGERLDHVVIGAGLQAAHPVLDRVAGSQHQHPARYPPLAQAPADIEAIQAGDCDVEDDQLGGRLLDHRQRPATVGR